MPGSIEPPSVFNALLEGRFVAEGAALLAQLPILTLTSPRGRGPVLVLPGFMADDDSTWLLRRFIDMQGYRAYPWNLGRNRGRMLDLLPAVQQRVLDVGGGEPVAMVGWSRGGIIAREIARERPDLVRTVCTLGSPVAGGASASNIAFWVARETGISPEQMRVIMASRQTRPIQTPITAVYSRTDGVVSWQACIDRDNPHVAHVEVWASHVGMGCNAQVFRAVAEALAP